MSAPEAAGPIDILAIAAARLARATDRIRATYAMQSGPAAIEANARAMLDHLEAVNDMVAARQHAAELAAAANIALQAD